MTEFELIETLRPELPGNSFVITGAGDDCAVLDFGKHWVLFKTDAVVEGVHFTAETPPAAIGHKALGRCLSDIAAMAGTPVSALVTLGLPAQFEPNRIQEIYRGMRSLAERHGVAISGGETTRNPERLFISVSMIGRVEPHKAILRSGARAGDAIFVSGVLGGSLAQRHLAFEPRLKEARWLASHFDIHSMMDISDGLAGDLRHILKASQAGAELLASAIPISREARAQTRVEASKKTALLAALTDGEDFELLFTISSKDAVAVLDGWKKEFPDTRLTCIGRIREGEGILLRDKDGVRPLNAHGYVHFAQS